MDIKVLEALNYLVPYSASLIGNSALGVSPGSSPVMEALSLSLGQWTEICILISFTTDKVYTALWYTPRFPFGLQRHHPEYILV